MLKAIAEGKYPAARVEALRDYCHERERRHRYAQVRNAGDTYRRTLVGAHVPRDTANHIAWIAGREGLSTTAFVKLALQQAIERSDTYRQMRAQGTEEEGH